MPDSTVAPDRKTLREFIDSRPLLTYIILAYAISWIAWPLSDLDLGVLNGIGVLASGGPALAAIIVSALIKPGPSGVPAGKRWRLFAITSLLALAAMTVRRLWISPAWTVIGAKSTLSTPYPSIFSFPVDVLGAAVVGLCLSGILAPQKGVADLFRSFDLRRCPVRWYWWVIALGFYPLVLAVSYALSVALGAPVAPSIENGPWHLQVADWLLSFILFLFMGGGLEEPGWRGFALPLLQKRFKPLAASLILALIWTIWHMYYIFNGTIQGGPVGLLVYFVTDIAPSAILFTALYNRTGGSLPVVILLHLSINVSYTLMPQSALLPLLWPLLMLVLGIWMGVNPARFVLRETVPATEA